MFESLSARLKENRAIIFVVLGAGLLRAAYLIVYAHLPDWAMLTVDNYYHQNLAENLASGNVLGDTTYFRAPFYVYCLGLIYTLFGSSLLAGRLFGVLVGLLSIIMTFRIGRRLFNRRVGLAAAVLQAIFPTVLYFEAELLLDPLFMLLVEISLYRFILWYELPDVKKLLWLSFALGLAAITRPTALVLLLPVVMAILITFARWRTRIIQIVLLVLGVAFVISPVTMRNLMVGREAVLISSQGGINFFIGNHSGADGVSAVMPEPLGHNWSIKDITYVAEKVTGKHLKPGEVSSYWYGRTISEILDNPLAFVNRYFKKLYMNFSNRLISNNRDLKDFFHRHSLLRNIPLSFGIVFALAFLGLSSGIKSHKGVMILAVAILFYSLVTALFFYNSRFRLPLIPLYLILAVAGIESFLIKIRTNRRSIVIPLILATSAGLFSYLPIVGFPKGAQPQHLISKGLHYYAQNDFQQSLKWFKEALQQDPTFPETNLNLGSCYLRLGKVDSALLYFETEKRIHPQRNLSYANIAAVYLLQDEPSLAFDEASAAIELKPYHENSHLIRLRAAAKIDEIGTDSILALATFAVAVTEAPLAIVNEAAAILTGRNEFDKAEGLLTQYLDPSSPPIETDENSFTPYYRESRRMRTVQLARVHYQLGYVYGMRRDFAKSIVHTLRALALDTTLVEAYINLAAGFKATGNFIKADSVLNDARRRFPDDSLAFR